MRKRVVFLFENNFYFIHVKQYLRKLMLIEIVLRQVYCRRHFSDVLIKKKKKSRTDRFGDRGGQSVSTFLQTENISLAILYFTDSVHCYNNPVLSSVVRKSALHYQFCVLKKKIYNNKNTSLSRHDWKPYAIRIWHNAVVEPFKILFLFSMPTET